MSSAETPPGAKSAPPSHRELPPVLPILPLRNSVFFPNGVLPLAVGREKTIALLKEAVRDDQVIGVVTQRRAEQEDPGAADLYSMGTAARIVKVVKMGENNYSLVLQGLERFRLLALVQESPYLKARVEGVEDTPVAVEDVEVEALAISLKKVATEVLKLMPELPAAATELVASINHPGHLADLIAANVDIPIDEKQQVLATEELRERLTLVLEVLVRKREILKLSQKIDAAVNGEMARAQRVQFLRQQLDALSEGDLGGPLPEWAEALHRVGVASFPPEVLRQGVRLFQQHRLVLVAELRAGGRDRFPADTALACSFCGRLAGEVQQLFAGRGAQICDACVQYVKATPVDEGERR